MELNNDIHNVNLEKKIIHWTTGGRLTDAEQTHMDTLIKWYDEKEAAKQAAREAREARQRRHEEAIAASAAEKAAKAAVRREQVMMDAKTAIRDLEESIALAESATERLAATVSTLEAFADLCDKAALHINTMKAAKAALRRHQKAAKAARKAAAPTPVVRHHKSLSVKAANAAARHAAKQNAHRLAHKALVKAVRKSGIAMVEAWVNPVELNKLAIEVERAQKVCALFDTFNAHYTGYSDKLIEDEVEACKKVVVEAKVREMAQLNADRARIKAELAPVAMMDAIRTQEAMAAYKKANVDPETGRVYGFKFDIQRFAKGKRSTKSYFTKHGKPWESLGAEEAQAIVDANPGKNDLGIDNVETERIDAIGGLDEHPEWVHEDRTFHSYRIAAVCKTGIVIATGKWQDQFRYVDNSQITKVCVSNESSAWAALAPTSYAYYFDDGREYYDAAVAKKRAEEKAKKDAERAAWQKKVAERYEKRMWEREINEFWENQLAPYYEELNDELDEKEAHGVISVGGHKVVDINCYTWTNNPKEMINRLMAMECYPNRKVAKKAFLFLQGKDEHHYEDINEYAALNKWCRDFAGHNHVTLGSDFTIQNEQFINVNTATLDQLQLIDGVDLSVASAIAIARRNHAIEGYEYLEKKLGFKKQLIEAMKNGCVKPIFDVTVKASIDERQLILDVLNSDHHAISKSLRNDCVSSGGEGEKNAKCRTIDFAGDPEAEVGFCAKMDQSSVTINDFTYAYADKKGGKRFALITGFNKMIKEGVLATDDLLSVNLDAIPSLLKGNDLEDVNLLEGCAPVRTAKTVRDDKFYVVKYQDEKGVWHQDVVAYDEYEKKYISLSRKDFTREPALVPDEYGHEHQVFYMVRYDCDDFDVIMTCRSDVMMFSTAMLRTFDRLYFRANTDEDVAKFREIRNAGENYAHGFLENLAENWARKFLIDQSTRNSSHMCSMGMTARQGCHISSIAIKLMKDDALDGISYIYVGAVMRMLGIKGWTLEGLRKVEELLGKQMQYRALSIKATGMILSAFGINSQLAGLNVARINVAKGADRTDEENAILEALSYKLVKGYSDLLEANGKVDLRNEIDARLKGIDVVLLYDGDQFKKDEDDDCNVPADHVEHITPDILADLNAVKNTFKMVLDKENGEEVSGLNVLAIPEYKGNVEDNYLMVNSSNQMFKVLSGVARAKNEWSKFEEMAKTVIDRAIKNETNLDERAKRNRRHIGFEPVNTSWTANVLQLLNKDDMKHRPELIRNVIMDEMRTLGNMVTLDRWPMAGAVQMLSVDPSYVYVKARDGKHKAVEGNDKYFPSEKIYNIRQDGTIEVYCAVFNAYAKAHGLKKNHKFGYAIKYPSMGTREMARIVFLSNEEVADRINALNLPFEIKLEIAQQHAHQGYGTIFAPADLKTMGWMLAGLDRDGDEIICMFCEEDANGELVKNAVWFLEAAGFRPLAVKIGTAGTNPELVFNCHFDDSLYNGNSAAMMDFGNAGVGPVTYAFMKAIQPLMVDWARDIKAEYLVRFSRVFKMGTETLEDQNGNKFFSTCYTNLLVKGEKADGYADLDFAHTDGTKAYDAIMDQLKHMAKFTGNYQCIDAEWAELVKIASDFDVLGRHTQELTIDAAKKFYKVASDFISDIGKQIGLVNQKFGIRFECDWKNALESDKAISFSTKYSKKYIGKKHVFNFDTGEEEDIDTFVPGMSEKPFYLGAKLYEKGTHRLQIEKMICFFPDFFAPMRRYAAAAAKDALNGLMKLYRDAALDEGLKAKRNNAFAEADAKIGAMNLRLQLNYAMDLATTVRHSYADKKKAYEDKFLTDDVSVDDESKYENAIRDELHAEFDEMFQYVNNMIRVIAEDAGLTPTDLINYVFGPSDGQGGRKNEADFAGKMLKEETAFVAISESRINYAQERISIRRGMDEDEVGAELFDAIDAGRKIHTDENGNVFYFESDDSDEQHFIMGAHVNPDRVPEGFYDAMMDEDANFYVTRPITNFIDILEANRDQLVIPVMMDAFGDDRGDGTAIEKIEEEAAAGKKFFVYLHDNGNGWKNPTICAKVPGTPQGEGVTPIAEVYMGSGVDAHFTSNHNKYRGVATRTYCGLMGDFAAGIQTESVTKNGEVKHYGFIVLDNVVRPDGVHPSDAEEQVDEDKLQDEYNQSNQGLGDADAPEEQEEVF